jgi:glycosyltransferase involved in cell wall biosynthesis
VYPVALEGFHDSLDGLVEVQPDADAFARALAALMDDGDRRRSMSEAGLKAAPQRLSNDGLKAYFESRR